MSERSTQDETLIRIDEIECRLATIDEIYELRYAVLRSGEKPVKLHFPGDGDSPPATWHFGAFWRDSNEGVQNIGCMTLFGSTIEPENGRDAVQLRGMAVAPGWRGKGIGTRLVSLAEATVRADALVAKKPWWCNARAGAIVFYEQHGYRVVSDEFVIETYGPHRKMVKESAL